MVEFSEALRSFYLNIIPEDEIDEASLIEKRIEDLEGYINGEIHFSEANTIANSALDAACLSIASGLSTPSPSNFMFTLENIETLGGTEAVKNALNTKRGSSEPWLFENRVRAWYTNHLQQTFPDLDDKYEGSVCEFAITIEDLADQMVEVKRMSGRLSEIEEEDFKEWYSGRYSKAVDQFESTENLEGEDLDEPKRHLIVGVNDVAMGVRGTQEYIAEDMGYEVRGCRGEDISEVKKWIDDFHEESSIEVDQVTIVWKNYFVDKEVRKGISERTEKVFSDEDIEDYKGWNIYGHTLQMGEFRRFILHHEPKEDNWIVAGMDADNKNFFSFNGAEETK